ncbi:hypothetical protein, partial [Actinomadura sp. 6K520]|uniref:YdeI/OmpD-associated family protein n=1 Tax=Actinomadura sp. 6K520 TaxID=2530364 RepID=UPI001A9FACAD
MMHFADAAQWEAWLAANHQSDGGAWLKIAKKGSAATSVTIGEALDVALCYGWIDSQRKSYDEHFYLQRYSRRRKGSPWSRVNVERVEALTEAGRMRPPGLAQVAAARADGRWDAAYTGRACPLPAGAVCRCGVSFWDDDALRGRRPVGGVAGRQPPERR